MAKAIDWLQVTGTFLTFCVITQPIKHTILLYYTAHQVDLKVGPVAVVTDSE